MAIDRVKTKANAEKALKAGKIQEAIREYQKLADDNPHDVQILNQIGQLHLRMGNKDLAVPCFLKVAELFNKNGFATKAVASLKIVTREDPDNLSAWEMLAGLSEHQGFTREAWQAFEKVGELCARRGDISGIIKVQGKLLEIEPDNLKVQVQLGDNLLKAGRKDEGVKHYLKAGAKLIAQGHVKEAARMYERALQIDPANLGALETAVKTHLAHHQAEVALQLLDSLLERSPDAEGVLLIKADVLVDMKDMATAEAICRKAMAANPGSTGALFRLVRALVLQQRVDEGCQVVDAWLRAVGPTRATEAEALYEEILRFAAGHVPTLKGLVDTARLSGRVDGLSKALMALGDSAAVQGPFPLAREAFQEIAQLEPNNLGIAEKLHAVERKMGLATQPFAGASAPSPAPSEAVPPPVTPDAPPAREVVHSEPQAPPHAAPPPRSVAPAEPPQIDLDIVVEETGEAEIDIEMDDLNLEPTELTSSLSNPAAQGHDGHASPKVLSDYSRGEESSEPPTEMEEEEATLEEPLADERAKGALSAQEADDIRENLTEAEVFLKYGLVEKAIGELQAILKKVPDHVHAHQKLIAIFRTQKKGDKVLRQLLKLASIFRDQGDAEKALHLVEEARTIDPNHKLLHSWEGYAAPERGVLTQLKAEPELRAVVEPLPEPLPALSVPLAPPPPAKAISEPEPEEVIILEDEASEPRTVALGELSVVEDDVLTPARPEPTPDLTVQDEEISDNLQLDLGEGPAEGAVEAGVEGDLADQLEEAEFYLSQELYGEAQRALKVLESQWPSKAKVKRFRDKLAKLAHGLPVQEELAQEVSGELAGEEEAEAPAHDEVLSLEMDGVPLDSEGSAESLPEFDLQEASQASPLERADDTGPQPDVFFEEQAPAVATPIEATVPDVEAQRADEPKEVTTSTRSRTKMKVSVKDLLPEEPEAKPEEESLKEDEYYDLASELGAALEGLKTPEEALFDEEGKSPEEMSFEEVFEEFKKGVEKKVGEEDYATHYNLGIAYKEMELLDEAIGEFQLAARSHQYFVECCSMLGICFRQKGLNELAEKWYRKGILAPGFADEAYIGLKYDLADCLQDQGRSDEARDIFKEVYAVQSGYRDIKERIRQLG